MHKQDIEIMINRKGEVTFEVKGVKGGSCVDETKFLEAALGGAAAVLDQQTQLADTMVVSSGGRLPRRVVSKPHISVSNDWKEQG